MFKRYIYLIITFFYLLQFEAYAQITSSGVPFYNPVEDTFFVPEINIDVPIAKFEQLLKEQQDQFFKKQVFAVPVEVDINPEQFGIWRDIPENNKKVWLLSIEAKGAVSLSLILDPFKLNPGVKLFFYDENQRQVHGAITSRNNKVSEILPIAQLYSGKIYVEMQVPAYMNDFGYFTISTLGVEPRSGKALKKAVKDRWYQSSASCHVNVNCINTSNVRLHRNSVVRILYRGTQRCTGTLINNLESDGKPYVLSAAHCFHDEYVANTALFYFNYESPYCEDKDGSHNTISGASLVAAGYYGADYDSLDFVLVELSETPPINYYPYYAGWDASGITPDSTYVVHHPMGDIKKITIDNDAPIPESTHGSFDPYKHWNVETYETGTTEIGSSGSALVSNENLIIGTLTGGGDTCMEKINDQYQMLSHSYNDYPNSKYQLKTTLDPKNTGLLKCNPFDKVGLFRESAQSIKNFDSTDVSLNSSLSKGWGYLAGHNYQGHYLFAEHFKIHGSKYLYGANVLPAAAYSSGNDQYVNFIILKGGEKPGEIIYEKKYLVSEIDKERLFYVDFDTTVLVNEEFYFGFQVAYTEDTFALKTINTTMDQNTSFTWAEGVWKPLQFDGVSHPSHMNVEILAFDFMPKKGQNPDPELRDEISIYPNPSDGTFQVLFKELPQEAVELNLYDLTGRMVDQISIDNPSINNQLDLNIERGIYILTISWEGRDRQSFKILVQ